MKWDVLQAALPQAIADTSGIVDGQTTPAPAVYWVGQDAQWLADVHVNLEVINFVSPYPADERRWTWNAGADQIDEHVLGVRDLTIQVTVESASQDLTRNALAFADAVRTKLHSTASRDLIGTANVALVSVGAARPAPYLTREDRLKSVAIFELQLRSHTRLLGGQIDPVEQIGVTLPGDGSETLV